MTKLTLKLFLPIMNLTISEERMLNIKIHIEMFFSVMDTFEEETEIVSQNLESNGYFLL